MTEKLICPACGRREELPVDTLLMPVVLVCPGCEQTYFGFRGLTYTLADEKIRELLQAGDVSDISRYLRGIVEEKQAPGLAYNIHGSHWMPRNEVISGDDIANLRIDLAQASTVDDVIHLLERC